jgi:hypothetical protein
MEGVAEEDDEYIYTADQLYRYTSDVLGEEARAPEEYVDDWLRWFRKRGERYLRDAALKGYYEVTLDLPFEIATRLDRPLFTDLMKKVKRLVPCCDVCIVEEEYGEDSDILYKLEISWR